MKRRKAAKVIPFPRPPLPEDSGVLASDGQGGSRLIVRCEDPVHVFAEPSGQCQCGERTWDEAAGQAS